MLHAKASHHACEKSLGEAYDLERNMRDVVRDMTQDTAKFVPQKCRKVYVRENKLDALDVLVEVGAFAREKTSAVPCLIVGKYEKTREERERKQKEYEERHNRINERRAGRIGLFRCVRRIFALLH